MTLSRLVRLLLKRWPALLVGVVITGGAVLWALQDSSIYWARTQVVFMAPSSLANPNSLQTQSEDLIITAGAVGKRVMGAEDLMKFASPDVNMIGIPSTGRDYWVRLPDTGGQWAPNFGEQLLLVDVVGSSPESVTQREGAVIDLIRTELDAMQREQAVNPVNDITVTVAPDTVVVQEIRGSRVRALVSIGILGIGGTVAFIVARELRSGDRRRQAAEHVGGRMLPPLPTG